MLWGKINNKYTQLKKKPTSWVVYNIGALFSKVLGRLWGEKEVRILILGLDGAGKTTILYRLQVKIKYFIIRFSYFLFFPQLKGNF